MANTPGGGALIVGVADDGTVIGTGLETEWLRSRIYDLTQRLLTVDVRETWLGDRRVLVVRSPQAIEPIRWRGKIHWRVSDRCVEVDAATWHARRMTMIGYDWSDLSSQVEPVRARPEALTLARDFLRASGEASAGDLSSARDPELLRRLNVVTADGYLTNAGTLAFVGRQAPALDYLRRATAGGDTDARVREGARSLLEEIAEVEKAVQQFNGTRQVQRGLVIGRVRDLPELTVREVSYPVWSTGTGPARTPPSSSTSGAASWSPLPAASSAVSPRRTSSPTRPKPGTGRWPPCSRPCGSPNGKGSGWTGWSGR